MKAIIVSSSYSYLERIELLKEAYEKKGYQTTVLLTDFIHSSKKFVEGEREGYVFVKTKPYMKNISPQRLYSHVVFAKDAFKTIEKMDVDLLHVLLPANALAKEAKRYKKQHPNVKVCFDLIDLWPETMPIQRFKKTPPFLVWKNLRDKNLDCADTIYYECGLYQEVLGVKKQENHKILYWSKASKSMESKPKLSEEQINLCYLGSVNNIIDMEKIVEICKRIEVEKPVQLHLIANGEKKEEFLALLAANDICVCDHGTIYDDEKKQQIFDQCHFGLNIMKSTVCVGLTMKSLDYFRAQLPIINNIKGDTFSFVEEYQIGFNESADYVAAIQKMKTEDYLQMRMRVKRLYEETFTKEAFFAQLNDEER